jgi:hypothetical protein
MAQADSVHSTPPINTSAPRLPTSQERAGDQLRRWRLARAAGIVADRRLDRDDRP